VTRCEQPKIPNSKQNPKHRSSYKITIRIISAKTRL